MFLALKLSKSDIMNAEDIKAGIKEILVQSLPELEHQELDWDKKQDQFESWDSFTHLEIMDKIEEKFGVHLEIEEIVELDYPRKIMNIIKNKFNLK